MKRQLTIAWILCHLSLASLPLYSQEADAPANFRVKAINMFGEGCEKGHASLAISADNQAFTAIFDDFTVDLAGTAMVKKNCRLWFDTEQDSGWEFAIVGVTARGYASLDEGVTGRQGLNYGSGSLQERERSAIVLHGPFNDDYTNAATVAPSDVAFSGCKARVGPEAARTRDFVIGAAIVLRSQRPGAAGLLTVDSLDGKMQMVYDIVWRRCGSHPPKHVALCQISATDGSSRSILGKGTSTDPATALAKARANVVQRCNAPGHGMSGGCSAARSSCQQWNI